VDIQSSTRRANLAVIIWNNIGTNQVQTHHLVVMKLLWLGAGNARNIRGNVGLVTLVVLRVVMRSMMRAVSSVPKIISRLMDFGMGF
jgi:hypothetical protein